MKKIIAMAALVLSSVGAFAQYSAGDITIQPKVGLNVSTAGDADWKAGFAVGAELQYQLTDKVGLAGGLLYSMQGNKSKSVTIDGDEYGGDDIEIGGEKWNPGYLNIPLTVNYYVVNGLALKAGVQPGFMIAKDKAEGVKTFDLSIPVGASYEYQNFVFDARYNIGVTKIADGADGYNNVIQLTVGYKFKL